MARYTNTLGIVAANSVVNHRDSLHATPVLKAVVRDLKKYLNFSNKSKRTRVLPVGYSPSSAVHINHSGFLEYLYFGDEENAIDFLAVSCHSRLVAGSKTLITHSSRTMGGRE
jgi:hypothetical protein